MIIQVFCFWNTDINVMYHYCSADDSMFPQNICTNVFYTAFIHFICHTEGVLGEICHISGEHSVG